MSFQEDFIFLREHVFEVCGFKYSQPETEDESNEYHAGSFKVQGKLVRYRQAKITPTKVGQFVTIWKRTAHGPIQPYDSSDRIDLFVVAVRSKNCFGQFVFPKTELIKQGVLSVKGKGGKRALRVYPPWDKAESKQAEKTQTWQLKFYVEIPKDNPLDTRKFKSLYLD